LKKEEEEIRLMLVMNENATDVTENGKMHLYDSK
jgi:hypothetical protein